MGFHITFDTSRIKDATRKARALIARETGNALEIGAVNLLSLLQLDYKVKARGGTGAGGIRWKRLKAETILARLRRAGHIGGNTRAGSNAVIAKKKKANEPIFAELEKLGAITVHRKKNKRGKAVGAKYAAGNRIEVHKQARGVTLDVANGNYEIGVDTGLQFSSLTPGFTGPDGAGGNLLQVTHGSVTVGVNRNYSRYFDKQRTIIPDPLPKSWVREIEQAVEDYFQPKMDQLFGGI